MSVFESIERYPAEYLPTGDKALLIAWAIDTVYYESIPPEPKIVAILCLEDGRVVQAGLSEFKLDYRYDNHNQVWVDVSKILDGPEGDHANTDQEDGDDGRPSVPGQVPDLDPSGQGDPGREP